MDVGAGKNAHNHGGKVCDGKMISPGVEDAVIVHSLKRRKNRGHRLFDKQATRAGAHKAVGARADAFFSTEYSCLHKGGSASVLCLQICAQTPTLAPPSALCVSGL